jgi:hypothetical protein
MGDEVRLGEFMVIRGHLDDSGDGKKIFTLSALLTHGQNWQFLTIDWNAVLAQKNKELAALGRKQLRRFHAADMSSFIEDFEGWNGPERNEFTARLLRAISKPEHRLYGFSFSINLQLLTEIIPDTKDDPKGHAYYLLLKLLMCDIGERIQEENNGDLSGIKVALIHDRCQYTGLLQSAFESMRSDKTFSSRSLFTTLAPMGWEDCVPLQPADFVAYETYKEALRQRSDEEKDRARSIRISFDKLLNSNSFRGTVKFLGRDEIEQLKKLVDKDAARIIRAQSGKSDSQNDAHKKGETP